MDNDASESKTPLTKSSNERHGDYRDWMEDESVPASLNPKNSQNIEEGKEAESTDPIDKSIARYMLYTRIINFVLSICMLLASLLSILTTNSATTGVLAAYVSVFACLLCCFETHLKQVSKIIAVNFGFLYSAKSRAVFMVFIGTLMFSFSLFGMIIGACMMANAAFNLYIIFKYPLYDEVQRKDAQAEIGDYLQANPAFANQVLSAGVKATTDFVAKNPGINYMLGFNSLIIKY